MIELACFDALKETKTFPNKLDLSLIRKMHYDYKLNYQQQAHAVLAVLQEQDKEHELQNAIQESLKKSKKRHF